MADFSLNNLSNNPSFNFLNTLKKHADEDENVPDFTFNNSPYENTSFLCEYRSETDFLNKYKNQHKPTVLSINVQSLQAKFNSLCTFINSMQVNNCEPDIICLQEIWKIPGSEFFIIDGYHPIVYKSRHSNTQGGGVGIYVKKQLNFSINHDLTIFVDRILESIFIDISINSKKYTIGSMYRPGTQHPTLSSSEQFSQFLELYSAIAEQFNNSSNNVFVFGDLNIDCLKYGLSNTVSDYVDVLFSHGLLQIVTKPTRVTLNSATLIDHITTNSSSACFDVSIIISQLSDHFPLLCVIGPQKPPSKPKMFSSRDFSVTNIDNFNNSLSSLNWNNVLSSADPQTSYTAFSDTFFSLYDTYFPPITKKFNKNFHKIEPWFTLGLLTSRRKKIALTKEHFLDPSLLSLNNLKCYRNLYNKVLRAAKKLFFDFELRSNQSNLKKSWELIRLAMKKKTDKSSSISNILVNNSIVSNPQEIAVLFNEFFTSISTAIVNEINPSDRPPDDLINDDIPLFSLADSPVTGTEIIDATMLLQPKKTADLMGISVWLIQKIIVNISVPLKHIFCKSFADGIVPQQLKIAKVVPVFKSGKKELMDNYRPISLLNCFSKIIEKIVCTRLTSFLDTNNLITNSQYGFRKKHSTIHPLIHFLNHVSAALDRRAHTLAIFCDLRKAFDCVNHKILLGKLHKLGIRGFELLWFQDYLTNRKQIVHVNGSNSTWLNILIGVPQGSILGPLLFLIYINDLPLCSELIALLFADDTTLYLSDTNLDQLIEKVNVEFKKVVDYFRFLKLALHPEKTKFILFTNSTEARQKNVIINLNFNNCRDVPNRDLITNLVRVTTDSECPAIKFLGIYIDPLLSFKFHINSISSKVSKTMYFLRSVKNILSQQALKSVYYSIVHSHFVYGIQVWSCTSLNNLSDLFLKQKTAIHIITSAKYNAHTEPLFKSSGILPLYMLTDFFKMQFFHRFILNDLPISFNYMWIRNEERNHPDQPLLRNRQEFYIPHSRLTSTEKFPLTSYPRLWSTLTNDDIKNSSSKASFNINLKRFFLDKLNANYSCTRLLCPHCHLST